MEAEKTGENGGAPPEELKWCAQWVAWRRERGTGRRERKVPIDPRTQRSASVDDPSTWSTYEAALAAARRHGHDGVGMVFAEGDPFAGVDLDGCVDPLTGEVAEWALDIVEALGSYTEISRWCTTGVKRAGLDPGLLLVLYVYPAKYCFF